MIGGTVADHEEAWRPYRRVGTVHAEVLDADVTWRTAHGDVLTSRTGDWWVWTTDRARGRGVAANRFAATHAPIPGRPGVYRRTGTLWARQLDAPLSVLTREGWASGTPTMWLVRDPDDAMWLVPDADFRAGYVPVASG